MDTASIDDKPEEIADFLEGATEEPESGATVDLSTPFDESEDPRDLGEESELVGGNSGIQAQPDPVGFEPSAGFADDPYRDIRVQVEQKFTKTYNAETVVVEEEERRRYLRAALHGDAYWFDIKLPAMDATVRVVPATPAWSDTITLVLEKWRNEGLLGNDISSWIDNFQLLHVWIQIDSVNGIPKPWLQQHIETHGVPGRREFLTLLSGDGPIDEVRNLNAAHRHMLLAAIRIAEIKNCICMDALSDGSFFSHAGTN